MINWVRRWWAAGANGAAGGTISGWIGSYAGVVRAKVQMDSVGSEGADSVRAEMFCSFNSDVGARRSSFRGIGAGRGFSMQLKPDSESKSLIQYALQAKETTVPKPVSQQKGQVKKQIDQAPIKAFNL